MGNTHPHAARGRHRVALPQRRWAALAQVDDPLDHHPHCRDLWDRSETGLQPAIPTDHSMDRSGPRNDRLPRFNGSPPPSVEGTPKQGHTRPKGHDSGQAAASDSATTTQWRATAGGTASGVASASHCIICERVGVCVCGRSSSTSPHRGSLLLDPHPTPARLPIAHLPHLGRQRLCGGVLQPPSRLGLLPVHRGADGTYVRGRGDTQTRWS